MRYIYIKGNRYYYFDSYDTINKAKAVALYYRRKSGDRYFIIKMERGFWYPECVFALYLNRQHKI